MAIDYNCVQIANADQANSDGDDLDDACDDDDDTNNSEVNFFLLILMNVA